MSKVFFALMALVASLSCTRERPPAKGGAPEPARAKVARAAAAPAFDHGFGGGMTGLQLIDRLKTDQALIDLLGAENVVRLNGKEPPPLFFTGEALRLDDCDAKPPGARHVAQLWTQSYLLETFSKPEEDWFRLALQSLQESDPEAIYRPAQPVHDDFVARLGKGADPNAWTLNGVRFRITDRGSLLGGADVAAQIKLNYELDVGAAAAREIGSASFIHSLAINPSVLGEFVADLFEIPKDPERSGCAVFKILDKYARNAGKFRGVLKPAYYFFMHTNVFDLVSDIFEWRFAELKPVRYDLWPTGTAPTNAQEASASRRGAFTPAARDAFWAKERQKRIAEFQKGDFLMRAALWGGENASLFSGKKTQVDACLQDPVYANRTPCLAALAGIDLANAEILGSYATMRFAPIPIPLAELGARGETQASGFSKPKASNRALRLRPIEIPFFRLAENPASADRELEVDPTRPPVAVFFSGSQSDDGLADEPVLESRLLVHDRSGQPLPEDHPAFRHEESFTCAGCHMRRHGTTVDAATGKLDEIAAMNFRHIGYGDGGNRNCSPMFGVARGRYTASVSAYLLEVANAKSVNGYAEKVWHPPEAAGDFREPREAIRELAALQLFAASPTEPFRCD